MILAPPGILWMERHIFFRLAAAEKIQRLQQFGNAVFLRDNFDNTVFQAGGLDESGDEKMEFFGLVFDLRHQIFHVPVHFRRLRQKLSIEQNIRDRSLRLVGDIADQCLHGVFFFGDAFCAISPAAR